ncbi:RNB domain-containing protein [Colletotrichum eremochloae]|nr:RNB domain-containing protein [Colletotrichum eremochloae]
MMRGSNRPYVCWRCLTAKTSLAPAPSGLRFTPQLQSPSDISRRSYAGARYKYGGGGGGGGRRRGNLVSASHEELAHIREKSDIRERLREWESSNREPSRRMLEDIPMQNTPLYNFLTRPDVLSNIREDEEETELQRNSRKNRVLFEADELADLRGSTSALLARRYGYGRLPVLAICLGRHHGLQYFYMSTGEVVPERNIPTLFTLTNFVPQAKLQPLIDILPEDPVTNPPNVLFHKHTPAALKAASRLQGELIKFYQDSVSFYQSHLTLDTAGSFLAHHDHPQYLNLEELADKLLPEYLKQQERFPPHALYAVHTALQRDDWTFRPLNAKWHRRNYIYEVRPAADIRILRKVENQVRELVEGAALRDNPAESISLLRKNSLGSFILKARGVIQTNRLWREWTPHGMIGPSDENNDNLASWTKQDVDYIRFMELWSCHRIVPKASQLESLGATILRLTKMYEEADWLAHWTGFTFLQEIGWIPPWEIPARYEYRFPDAKVHRGADMVMPPVDINSSFRPDIAQGHRRDWGETTVFCVDSEQTADVDDGFSIEATEDPGVHWIHVHIADPASRIDPKSELARQLQKAPSSLYLPGFPNKMMPRDLEQQFSLDPGRPALTFSAKVNERGDMLDYKVEPGTLQNVLHVPKNEVASILPGPQPRTPSDADAFAVGRPPAPPQPVKRITTAADLAQKDRDDLVLLDRLCAALKDRRVEKGQLPQFQPRFSSPEVSLDAVVVKGDPDVPDSMAWKGDPFIKLTHPHPTAADRLWAVQALLRAWRFGEAPLPARFAFVVDGLYPFGLRGRLENFYGLAASIDLARLDGVARLADVHVDDRFEVEIHDINVVTTLVSVQPLRRLAPAGTDAELRGADADVDADALTPA